MHQVSLHHYYYDGHWSGMLHGDIRVRYRSLGGKTGFVEDYRWKAPDDILFDWVRDGSNIPFFPYIVATGVTLTKLETKLEE